MSVLMGLKACLILGVIASAWISGIGAANATEVNHTANGAAVFMLVSLAGGAVLLWWSPV